MSLDYPGQKAVIEGALRAPSPESAAAFNRFVREQERRPIWNGRPSMNRGIPIQLYHPSFAKFLRVTRKDTGEINLTPADYSATHSLFHSSAMLYIDKAERLKAISIFIDKAIGYMISSLYIPGVKASGAYRVLCDDIYALVALKEIKNEIGTGGRDPSHQCGMGFRYYYAQENVCPSLPCSVLVSQINCR